MKSLGEWEIQNGLFMRLRRKSLWPIFTNTSEITGYECDVLAITHAGYSFEYEIKCSKTDFRMDIKKRNKHAALSGRVKEVQHPRKPYTTWWVRDDAEPPYRSKDVCEFLLRPKRFWYVIHGFDVRAEELPPYAGLMKVRQVEGWKHCVFDTVTSAPDLKPCFRVDVKRIEHAKSNFLYRYWNQRIREQITNPGEIREPKHDES